MQLFTRLSAGHFGTFGFGVFLEEEVRLGSLVKLCGKDRTGKSALLYHMAVQCVLPKQVPGGVGGEWEGRLPSLQPTVVSVCT